MTAHQSSAVVAILIGVILLPVCFIPYVAWSYRRRGTLSLGNALIAAGTLIYLMALWTYTILPLPDPETLDCSVGGVAPQLVPFASLAEIDIAAHGWRDPMLVQLVANVALFVPFGMLLRHVVAPRHPAWLVLAGFGTSLLIEITQLTGVFGAYSCAYRMFDVDDLITNTTGAAIGVLLAPALRLIPGQRRLPEDQPQEVTRGRRLLGMFVDFLSVLLVSFLIYLPIGLWAKDSGSGQTYTQLNGWVQLAVTVALLLAVPWRARGATLGQLVTYVRPVGADGGPPSSTARLIRFLTGSGGYFVLSSISEIGDYPFVGWVSNVWLVLSAAAVLLWHPRGISGLLSGLTVGDTRDAELVASRARRVDPRSLGVAVLAAGFIGLLAALVFSEIAAVAPMAGLALGVLLVGALSVIALGFIPYLVVIGVVTIRREHIGLATLLPLLTVAALLGLAGLLILGFVTSTSWLFIPATAALAVTGYLGAVFLVFLIFGQWYARRDPAGKVDAVVVLGSRVFGERVPPLLAARIDRGIQVLEGILDRDPAAATILVCSGGQGPDEDVPEGEAMARYARAHGAPAERVLAESESRDTEENLRLTAQLLASRGLGTAMVAVTNDYHAFRAAIIARELGVDAQVVGAPTAHYYFPTAVIREFVGVLARRPLPHVVIALALAVLAAGVAYMVIS